MALKIRLRQQGRNNRTTYRLVVTDVRCPRDGKYIELLGWYNPLLNTEEPFFVNAERVSYWLSQGAELTDRAQVIVSKAAPDVVKALKEKAMAKKVKLCIQRKLKRKNS